MLSFSVSCLSLAIASTGLGYELFFHCIDKADCKKSAKALMELENIDDEADQLGIAFVKINDEDLAREYNLGELPKLVYYRNQIPIIYEGECPVDLER